MWPRLSLRLVAVRQAALTVSCCFLLAGCGSGAYSVSGNVTFAGKPIPVGKIYFTPDAAKGNTGPAGYAEIKDGKYSTSAAGGRDVIGGPMVVRITAADGVKIDEERPNGKPLFPPYQVVADLPKSSTTKDFDVPASATKPKPGAGAPIIIP